MKTKDLIALLQQEDPSGEGDVLVMTEDGNVDIFYLEWKQVTGTDVNNFSSNGCL